MRPHASIAALVALGGLLACAGAEPDGRDDAGISDAAPIDDAGAADSGQTGDPRFLNLLNDADALASLTSTLSEAVKYLAPVPGAAAFEPLTEPCYFQNMRLYAWHLPFLQSFPELGGFSYDAYLSVVLHTASRRLYGGAVKFWSVSNVISYALYADPGALRLDDVANIDGILKSCMPYATELLVFVPESPDQRAFAARERANLIARGVTLRFLEDLR